MLLCSLIARPSIPIQALSTRKVNATFPEKPCYGSFGKVLQFENYGSKLMFLPLEPWCKHDSTLPAAVAIRNFRYRTLSLPPQSYIWVTNKGLFGFFFLSLSANG
jgi:hypothetical protein